MDLGTITTAIWDLVAKAFIIPMLPTHAIGLSLTFFMSIYTVYSSLSITSDNHVLGWLFEKDT